MSKHTNAFCSSTCAVFLILSAIAFERGRELYILRQNIFCMNPTTVQLTVQSKHNSTHILNILNFNCDIFKRYIMRVTIPFFLLALVINVTRSWPTVNKIFFQVLIFCLGVKKLVPITQAKIVIFCLFMISSCKSRWLHRKYILRSENFKTKTRILQTDRK